MENKTKLTIGVIITLAMLLSGSGTYYLSQDDDAYHCESKDMVMLCEKLSSGIGSRCYYESTYKICREGWTKIEEGQEVKDEIPYVPVSAPAEGKRWLCSYDGCIKLE